MASRMDRYHSNNSNMYSRSLKNENLYKDIYENTHYSNIENVTSLNKTNEIDLSMIKELLEQREQYKKKEAPVRNEVPKSYNTTIHEERNYDIRDIMKKAKDEKVDDNKSRSLRNIQYDFLKKNNVENEKNNDIENTLVSTGVLNKIGDGDLSLDMLSDLKSDGDTFVESTNNVKDLLKEVAEAKDNYKDVSDDDNLDKSFYTSSLNFKDDDFEQLKEIQDSIESNNKMIKVLFYCLFFIIFVIVGYFIIKII